MSPTVQHYREEIKGSLILAVPVVIAQVAQNAMGFIDVVMVGRLGSQALASVALGNTIFFFLMVVCMGLIVAVEPMVSQAYGAGETEPVARSVRQGLWLGVAVAVPVFFILHHIGPLLLLIGQDPLTVQQAEAYLAAISWSFFPWMGYLALRSFLAGLERPRVVTVIVSLGVLLNVVANYALIFGNFGFPALGIVGSGWATTLVYWVMFFALVAWVQLRPEYRQYGVFAHTRKPDPEYFRELFQIGWPIGISFGVESGLFMMTALMMGLIGTETLAAHQLAIQCAAFTFMVPLGLSIATSVRVGHAVGRRDPDAMRRAGVVGIWLAALFMTGTAILFWTIPRTIISIFLDVNDPANVAVVGIAVKLLFIAAVFQLFDGIQVAAAGALRGLKDTRRPMVINFVSYWILGLTTGYVLGFRLDYGAEGLWWGLVLGLTATSFMLTLRFRRQVQQRAVSVLS